MRFILLFIFAYMIETSFAQVKLNESFEGTTFPPTGWTKKGGNIQNGENWSRGISTQYFQCHHSGQAGAVSESYIYPDAVTPNNWLISPVINVQTGDSLELWVKPSNNTYPSEHFEVKVSSSNSDTASFSSLLYNHTFVSGEGSNWTQLKFNLSQFAGQNIYIAFIHNNCNGQNMLLLDDVKVWHSTNASITQDNTGNAFSFNNNLLTIKNLEQISELKIYDIAGKLILNNSTNELKNTYNLSHLQKGIYFINLLSKENKSISFKIYLN